MRRPVASIIIAVSLVISCGGSAGDDVPNVVSSDAVEAAPTAITATEGDDATAPVPFPPPDNVVTFDEPGGLELGAPASIFDLYDDIAPIDDFVVYEDGRRQVSMTEAYVKQGRTYGYVTWTDANGALRSTSSPASHELATCAADVLAGSMDRFDAEITARGVVDEGNFGARSELIDLYIACDGTDELLTSFRDDIVLGQAPFDIACIEASVTTADHLRTVSDSGGAFLNQEFLDLAGPCFNWSVVGFDLADTSRTCLAPRNIDGLRAVVDGDFEGFASILEACLTPEEMARLGG